MTRCIPSRNYIILYETYNKPLLFFENFYHNFDTKFIERHSRHNSIYLKNAFHDNLTLTCIACTGGTGGAIYCTSEALKQI